MISFDDVVKKNIKEYNTNWLQIPDHPFRILIIGRSGSGTTNSLFNLINQQPDIDQIYLHVKDLYEAKYQFLIKNLKILEQSILMTLKFFLNTRIISMIFIKPPKIIIQIENEKYFVFDDMIVDMLSNKKLNPIVTELFIRGRKLNISLVFITQSILL